MRGNGVLSHSGSRTSEKRSYWEGPPRHHGVVWCTRTKTPRLGLTFRVWGKIALLRRKTSGSRPRSVVPPEGTGNESNVRTGPETENMENTGR